MELRDLVVTPILLVLICVVAYMIRPFVTDQITRRYFFPALGCKIFGALAVGLIYQFYYSGGDTFNYHTHGSRHVWEAFMDDPDKGVKLLTSNGEDYTDIYRYASKILFFSDPSSYAVIKIASIFDLITFSTYSATAVLFAICGFIGVWLLFITFYRLYPHLHYWIALAVLFIPSVIFWGSGLLKDTITLSCIGLATYATFNVFIRKKLSLFNGLILFNGLYGLYAIKIYILLTFLPAAIVWVSLSYLGTIRSSVLRFMMFPFMALISLGLGYYAINIAGKDSTKYSIDTIAKTAQITAYDIRYYTGRDAGSGYSLGELDGTWQSMVRLMPQAINVSLFRPYLWEARNPLMLLSALESFALLLLTLYTLYRMKHNTFRALGNATVVFCLIFSIGFAFAVGVSTFNFGTLTRYKIPLMPFYALALIIILDYSNRERKVEALELTE